MFKIYQFWFCLVPWALSSTESHLEIISAGANWTPLSSWRGVASFPNYGFLICKHCQSTVVHGQLTVDSSLTVERSYRVDLSRTVDIILTDNLSLTVVLGLTWDLRLDLTWHLISAYQWISVWQRILAWQWISLLIMIEVYLVNTSFQFWNCVLQQKQNGHWTF